MAVYCIADIFFEGARLSRKGKAKVDWVVWSRVFCCCVETAPIRHQSRTRRTPSVLCCFRVPRITSLSEAAHAFLVVLMAFFFAYFLTLHLLLFPFSSFPLSPFTLHLAHARSKPTDRALPGMGSRTRRCAVPSPEARPPRRKPRRGACKSVHCTGGRCLLLD